MKYKLSDICSGITDGSHNPPAGISKSNYLMLSSKNVFDDEITFDDPRYLSEEQYVAEHKRTGIMAGDVLMTIVGTVGRTAVVSDGMPPITLQRSVAVLHPLKDVCLNRYLMYVLRSKRNVFESEAHGVAQKGIYLKQLSSIVVEVPEVERQKKVVQILDQVQQVIKRRQKELSKLDDLIKARFVELFGDTVLNPFQWNKDLLGMVCDVRDGTHDSPQYYETGFPLVTSKNVTGGRIDLTDCSLICKADYEKINERSKVDMGDIIMPMIGTVGNPVIVDIEPLFAIKNVALIKFRADSRVLNSYVQALLQSDYFDDAVFSKVRGGTQKFISLGDIRKLEVLVPPMERQQQFATFVAQVDKSKAEVQKSLDEAQVLLDSLMQQYFG